MTEITVHPTGEKISIPSSWDEMTDGQVQFTFRTYDECTRKGRPVLEFKIRVLYYLMGIKTLSKYASWTYKKPSYAEKIAENTAWLCHSCLDFLFEKQEEGEIPHLAYKSIHNSLPAVRSRIGPLLTGPADILQDLTFGEFRHASSDLNSFFKSRDIRDLDECISYLYRRRYRKANRAGRKVSPIQAESHERDVRLVSSLPSWQKNMIMLFFSSCIEYLQTQSLEIDGELVEFGKLFSGDSGESRSVSFNWNDLQVQLSREGVIGNMDRVDEEPLFKIFSIMWTNFKENESNATNRKTR